MLAKRERLLAAIQRTRLSNSIQESEHYPVTNLMRRIPTEAFLEVERAFITPEDASDSGSTAATVLLLGRRLFAANVGDSRVLLCRKCGKCVQLTNDHKPSREEEEARILYAGGFIRFGRVMGELLMTRAFGDKSLKVCPKAMPKKRRIPSKT